MNAPCVLLLHGAFLSSRMWVPQVDALRTAGARIVVPDLRGHGAKPFDGAPYTVGDLARDALKLLDGPDQSRVVLVGHSLGAMIALELARLAPERVAGLLLMDASAGLRANALDALLTSFVDASLRLSTVGWQADLFARSLARYSPDADAYVREELSAQAATPQRYRAVWRAASRYQPEALSEIRCPVLVLAGARPPRAAEQARALAARLPDARVEIIPGAGHLPNMDQPGIVNAAIARMMAGRQ